MSLSVGVSACIDNSEAKPSYDIAYSVASTGVQTGINSQQTHVIKNSTEYSSLMSGVQIMGVTPNPDFRQSMLVGIFTTLNSCYTTSVDSVKNIEGSIVITITISSESVEVCNPVIGSSYVMVSMDQYSKQVSVLFKEI